VSSDLLESLQVLSELGVDTVGDELSPVAFTDISLSVEEPLGNVVVSGLGKNVVDLVFTELGIFVPKNGYFHVKKLAPNVAFEDLRISMSLLKVPEALA
jgi:hypothetical protein